MKKGRKRVKGKMGDLKARISRRGVAGMRLRHRMATLPLGRRIRGERERLELSRDEAARRAGIPPQTWKSYELGWARPSAPRIAAIARVLGRSSDWLLEGVRETRAEVVA